ncbi:hypothetical protein CLOM_g18864 [Closterium sp. NIES-68]|nr:hypothetical protein CLOM_g18864 [Closterium sp. NIES-68]GJP76762.1 hypothetical protein CLOP_g7224 [Closterium sp. NIES-67]
MEEQLISKAIRDGVPWDQLPKRAKLFLGSNDEYIRRVKEHCFQLRLRWPESPAKHLCRELDYYNELLAHGRKTQAPFPYHLADYICRVLRISPFRYYSDLLLDVMKQEKSYDTIPNFTAADALRETGIGRNQFIDIMNRARAKLMWRVNRGIVKDMLPLEPVPFPIQPWWLVCVVNLSTDEYRRLTEDELSIVERGGREGDCMAGEFDEDLVRSLYVKGLIYLDVPVYPNDRFRVSSLEGFVSNKNQQDASEKLLYSLFVTASEQATVHEMALTLQADVRQLGAAISLACRLGWAEKVLDLESLLEHMDLGGEGEGGEGGEGGGADRLRIALMVDANLTSFLMMGSFSYELKQHAVTLFEAGKLSERSVAELCGELRAVEKTQLEGELQKFTDHAFSLRYALSCLRTGTIDITSTLQTPRPTATAATASAAPAPVPAPDAAGAPAADAAGALAADAAAAAAASEPVQGEVVTAGVGSTADVPTPEDAWSTRSVADSASTADPSDLPLPIPSHLVASSSSQSLPDSVNTSHQPSSHADPDATATAVAAGASASGLEQSRLHQKSQLHPRAASYPSLPDAEASDDGSSSPAAPPPPPPSASGAAAAADSQDTAASQETSPSSSAAAVPAAATLPTSSSSTAPSAAAVLASRATFNRVEVLRTESLQGLAPATLHRLLRRDFDLVVSIVPLPKPLNAVVPDGSGPAHFGPPAPAFLSPWAKLFLYAKTASGPVSVVLMRGLRLRLLPPPLVTCDKALVWTWDGMAVGGVGAKSEGSLVPGTVLLHVLNSLLRHSAVMVQPLAAPPASVPAFSRSGSNTGARGGGGGEKAGFASWVGEDGAGEGMGEGVGCLTEEGQPDVATIALPLPPRPRSVGDAGEACAAEKGVAGERTAGDGATQQQQGGRSLGRSRLASGGGEGDVVERESGGQGGVAAEGASVQAVEQGAGQHGAAGQQGAVGQQGALLQWEEESPIVAAARRAAEVLALDAVGFVRVIRTEAGEEEEEEEGREEGGAAGTGGGGGLRIDVSGGAGSGETSQGKGRRGQWVAHSIEYGIPLFDTRLCCQVCETIVAQNMLTPAQLASQRVSTLALRSALREFICDYRQHGPVSRAVYTGNVALLRSTSRRWSASFAASAAADSPFSVLLPRRTVRHVPPSPSGRGAGERGVGRGRGKRGGEMGSAIAAAVAAVDAEKGEGRGRRGHKHRLSRNFSEFWFLPENQAPSFAARQDDPQDPDAQSNRDPSFTSEEEEDDLCRPAYPGVNMIFDGHLLLPIDLSTYLHGRQTSSLVARATSVSQQSIMW